MMTSKNFIIISLAVLKKNHFIFENYDANSKLNFLKSRGF